MAQGAIFFLSFVLLELDSKHKLVQPFFLRSVFGSYWGGLFLTSICFQMMLLPPGFSYFRVCLNVQPSEYFFFCSLLYIVLVINNSKYARKVCFLPQF